MGDSDALARRPLREVNPLPAHPWYVRIAKLEQFVLTRLVDLDWSGLEKIPPSGGIVVAVNHISYADPPLLNFALVWGGRWPRFLAKAELFDLPVLGRLGHLAGMIPVHRHTTRSVEALGAALDALRAGECVTLYPEGTITRDPDLWPMTAYPGAARLALGTGCPVVPVAQWGAQDIMPGDGPTWPRLFPRKRYTVRVGDPVDLEGLEAHRPDDIAEATRRITDAITRLVAEIRGVAPPEGRWDRRLGRRVSPGVVTGEGDLGQDEPMADFTDQEKDSIRRAVLGALAYVSKADPGFFATFSESAAGAKALAAAPGELRDLLAGGLIMPEASSPQDFDASVVPNLQAAVHLVAAKDPAWADALKQVVLTAVQQVAEASKGVTAEEQSAVDRIREGLA